MDKIEKLFKKISLSDREALLKLTERLLVGDRALAIIKLKNSDFYRARQGNFRIIFHKDKGDVIIDSIKLRDEKTYKKL